MEHVFPFNLESGQRIAIVLTPAGVDDEHYVIGENTTESDVREKLGENRRFGAIVNVE